MKKELLKKNLAKVLPKVDQNHEQITRCCNDHQEGKAQRTNKGQFLWQDG